MYALSTRSVHFIHENLSVIKIERFHLVDKLTLKHCGISGRRRSNVVLTSKTDVD